MQLYGILINIIELKLLIFCITKITKIVINDRKTNFLEQSLLIPIFLATFIHNLGLIRVKLFKNDVILDILNDVLDCFQTFSQFKFSNLMISRVARIIFFEVVFIHVILIIILTFIIIFQTHSIENNIFLYKIPIFIV